MIPSINIKDYNYPLPEERIAKYPLPRRDSSKLLEYKDGTIRDHVFTDLPSVLPQGALMIFNDTKVVPARLHFQRETGAIIEIFCLEPVDPCEYNISFASTEQCSWKCIVGNVKKWKGDTLSLINPQCDKDVAEMALKADLVDRDGATATVRFTWQGGIAFSKVLEIGGNIPIPPYLNRETESIDLERYQTLYAKYRGSVAAPTAGLHFTDEVLEALSAKGIERQTVCLHVGAGTFLPVKADDVSEHVMHREPFVVKRSLIAELLDGERPVVAVGTTSVRTLESLYYAGVSCIENGEPSDVSQWAPYEREYPYSRSQAFSALLEYLDKNSLESLTLGTRIIIVPGFDFKVVDILVTNFHQPQSTLLLLISALLKGNWQPIYEHALDNGYRFLSYGDSSVLFRVK